MTTTGPYYGDEYTLMFQNVPSTKPNPGDYRGSVSVMYFSMATPPVAPTANDYIYLTKIPKGAIVLNIKLWVPDQGTVGAFDLGWADSAEKDAAGAVIEAKSDTGFITTQDCHTAAGTYDVAAASATAVVPAGIGKRFLAEVDLVMKITTAWDVGVGPIAGYVTYVNY